MGIVATTSLPAADRWNGSRLCQFSLVQAVHVPVGRRLGGRLATSLMTTINNIIFLLPPHPQEVRRYRLWEVPLAPLGWVWLKNIRHRDDFTKNYKTYYRSPRMLFSKKFRTILNHFVLYWSIFSYLALSSSILDFLLLYPYILFYIGLSSSISLSL